MRYLELQALISEMLYVHDEGITDDTAIQELGRDPFEEARSIAWPTPEETILLTPKLKKVFYVGWAALFLSILFQVASFVIREVGKEEMVSQAMRDDPHLVYEVVHSDKEVCAELGGVLEGDDLGTLCILDDCTIEP